MSGAHRPAVGSAQEAPAEGDLGVAVRGARGALGTEGAHLLRVGVAARDLADEDRPPAHLTFVVDTSGSMDIRERLGLVQASLGSIVVLTTSTLNRVMVVELALPAIIPGVLVALHYAVQVLRPRLGYGSDVGGRRTPWIVGGMAALAVGGTGAGRFTVARLPSPSSPKV